MARGTGWIRVPPPHQLLRLLSCKGLRVCTGWFWLGGFPSPGTLHHTKNESGPCRPGAGMWVTQPCLRAGTASAGRTSGVEC